MSWVSRQTGHASTPPNCLKRAALPSITGRAAVAPMLPRPSTAEPSVTTATVLRLMVSRRASSGCSAIARHTRATPGVYARDRSSRCFNGTLGFTSILPPRCMRKVRSLTLRTTAPGIALMASVIRSACASSDVSHVTSTTIRFVWLSTTSRAVSAPPAEPTAVVSAAVAVVAAGTSTRTVIEYPGLVDAIDGSCGTGTPRGCHLVPSGKRRAGRAVHLGSFLARRQALWM